MSTKNVICFTMPFEAPEEAPRFLEGALKHRSHPAYPQLAPFGDVSLCLHLTREEFERLVPEEERRDPKD